MQKYYKKYFAPFLLPLMICFIFAFVVPFLMGIYFSFTKFITIKNAAFTGFENYQIAFGPGTTFWSSFGRTVAFVVVSVLTINIFAFLLALLLTRGLKLTNFFRSVFFMPNLIGGIVLGYIWNLLINGILNAFGTNIYANPAFGFWGLVVLMNWQQVGYMMVIYIAALMNVPQDLTESAQVDGAGKFAIVKNITIPMIAPSITICTFLTLTNGFKLYDQNLALTGYSVPENQLLALNIFNTMFNENNGNMGPGQAKAVIFFIVVASISFLQLYTSRKREVEV